MVERNEDIRDADQDGPATAHAVPGDHAGPSTQADGGTIEGDCDTSDVQVRAMILSTNPVVEPPASDEDEETGDAIYARFSTREQKASSIDRQVAVCRRYMRKLGLENAKVYADRARSARYTVTREQLQKLFKKCEAGKIRRVFVEHFDRWSREIYDAVQIYEKLEALKVELHSASEERRLTKRDVAEAAVAAELDRLRRSNILGAGRVQLAVSGGVPSGASFGYRNGGKPGFLVIDEVEATVIRRIFEMAAEGLPYRAIAAALVATDARGPRGREDWSPVTLAKILRQPLYVGRVVYGRYAWERDRKTLKTRRVARPAEEVVVTFVERLRIVPDELWMRAQRRGRAAGGRRAPSLHLLTNRVGCDCGGAGRDAHFHVNGVRALCGRHRQFRGCVGAVKTYPTREVERVVVDTLAARLRSSAQGETFAAELKRSMAEAGQERRSRRAAVEAQIARVEAERRKLLSEAMQEAFGVEYIQEQAKEQRATLDALREEADALRERAVPADLLARFGDFAAMLDVVRRELPFRASTSAEAAFLAALRRIVRRVEFGAAAAAGGQTQVAIEVDFAAMFDGMDGAAEGRTETLYGFVSPTMSRLRRTRTEVARLRADGGHRLSDEQWAAIAGHVPDVTIGRGGRHEATTRDVVDALMLRLRTGLAVESEVAGDTRAVRGALLRFVCAEGDRIVVERLGRHDSDLVEGLDASGIEATRARWQARGTGKAHLLGPAGRVTAASHRPGLTDRQWAVCAPLISPGVGAPKGRWVVDPRTYLDALLLKLRADVGWNWIPVDGMDGRSLMMATMRLHQTGSWKRVEAAWRLHCPELLADLDVEGFGRRLAVGAREHLGREPYRKLAPRILEKRRAARRRSAA